MDRRVTREQPSVTVLMAVHDGERWLPTSLGSLRAQTYGDLELLVIDDGSTDSTPRMLATWPDPRLRVVRREGQGLTRALAHGVMLARGSYIARMDADDEALPRRLESQLAFLERHPDVVLCGTWAEIVNDEGRRLEVVRTPVTDELIRAQLLWDNALFHSSWMVRTDAIRAVGGYDIAVERAQDYDLAVRLERAGRLANLPRPLLRWRRSAQGISVRQRALQRRSVGETSFRTITAQLGTTLDEDRFWRLRAYWDGDRDDLETGDGIYLARIVRLLPRAAGGTLWMDLISMVAGAVPAEAGVLLRASWQGFPDHRLRLASPKRLVYIAGGLAARRAGRWFRHRLRGY